MSCGRALGRVASSRALEKMGEPALEALLRAYDEYEGMAQRSIFLSILAGLKVKDDRIYERLMKTASFNTLEEQVVNISIYGDARALPWLRERLDSTPIGLGDDAQGNHLFVELGRAMEDLGGELSPRQTRKIQRALAVYDNVVAVNF